MEKWRKGTLEHSAGNDLICPLPPVSGIEPVLELSLETPEHLFFDAIDISKLASTSHVNVFGKPLNLYDKLFHQPSLSGYFSRKCCLQNPAVCFCRFLVLKPLLRRTADIEAPVWSRLDRLWDLISERNAVREGFEPSVLDKRYNALAKRLAISITYLFAGTYGMQRI